MLEVRGLTLRYPNGKQALTGVDLTVQPGELVVVLGGNGSGKTTLLRCLTRTLTPTGGTVSVAGRDMTALAGEELRQARTSLALVSQHASLVKRRSVRANVASGALGHYSSFMTSLGRLPREELTLAHKYLDEVGLADLAGQRAGTLSGGQAQRVAIARALAQRPRAVLADEPVASLDPEAAEEIMRLLKRLAKNDNLAVLCVLHQIDLAYGHADRVVGIRDGRVAFDLPKEDVARERVHDLYLSQAA
ncbi:MAG TPA: phosphonate ABC transporter ATP-binding protein [Candidatus Binatia bacterium]|nr:phosphonate ABC transporter ATP-binding protein [Candidatus Binatia bacterium]